MLLIRDDQKGDPSAGWQLCQRHASEGYGDRLRLEAGDRVLAVETDRAIFLTPYEPRVEPTLKVAAKAAKKYRNALRKLAK